MSNSKSARTGLVAPVLEPTTQKFIDALAAAGGPPIYTLSPEAARDLLARAQAQPVAKAPASIEDTTFLVAPPARFGFASSDRKARRARCRW